MRWQNTSSTLCYSGESRGAQEQTCHTCYGLPKCNPSCKNGGWGLETTANAQTDDEWRLENIGASAHVRNTLVTDVPTPWRTACARHSMERQNTSLPLHHYLPLPHGGLHEAAQVGVVVPDDDSRDDAAVLVGVGFAFADQAFQGVPCAREHGVGGRQGQRGAEIVGAVAAVHDALVRVLPPQTLQLLSLQDPSKPQRTAPLAKDH